MQSSPLLFLTAGLFVVVLLFGGGTRQGYAVDFVPLVASLPLLLIVLPQGLGILRRQPVVLFILLGILAVPLIQLIPLPPQLRGLFFSGGPFLDILQILGAREGWQPVSVFPEATFRAFLGLVAPVTFFLAVICLDRKSRFLLLYVLMAIAIMSIFVAGLQIYGRASSPFYFYEFTSVGTGVGFFANPNHQATFIFASIPLLAVCLLQTNVRLPVHPLVALIIVTSALSLGLAMTGSRTALLLGIVSISYVFFQARSKLAEIKARSFMWGAAVTLATLVPLAGGVGFSRILQRFEGDVLENARWTIASGTWRAIREFFPTGSGMGTFVPVYQMHETAAALVVEEVNRAHNDVLELLLEGGIFSGFLISCFLAWLAIRSWKIITSEKGQVLEVQGAASLSLVLISVHSLWDYPLRTTAMCCIFALSVAFLSNIPDHNNGTKHMVRRRHRKVSKKTLAHAQ